MFTQVWIGKRKIGLLFDQRIQLGSFLFYPSRHIYGVCVELDTKVLSWGMEFNQAGDGKLLCGDRMFQFLH